MSDSLAPGSLPVWVANPVLHSCWIRLRDRFEALGLVASGTATVAVANREERHALGELLGRSITRDRVTVHLAALDARLRERSGIGGLADVLVLVTGGPLVDRPADRAERTQRRAAPLELGRRLLAEPWSSEWGEEWLAGLRHTGVLTNRDDALTLVRDAVAVLRALVRERAAESAAQSRVELAARVVGDAHGLDEDRLLTQLVLRGLAAATGCPAPATASGRRDLWEEFAVAPDLLSRTCLVLGLHPEDASPGARRLCLASEAGDPVHLTDWDLHRLGDRWQPEEGAIVVCENPRVLEAVAQTHAGSRAVVCTSGEPNTVATALLRRLTDAGHRLDYHGDFDWPGIAIANRMAARFGAMPWRMTAADYEMAARADGPPLTGSPVEPSWDAELGAAMRAMGRAVHEESVLPVLLDAMR